MEGNLDELLRFLRQVGVGNPRRFLAPMALNAEIARALAKWKREWEKDGSMENKEDKSESRRMAR
jgi:hypothetical protein